MFQVKIKKEDKLEMKNKENRLKIKERVEEKIASCLEIFLLITSIFAFSFIISAPTSKAQEVKYCCEKTSYGAWCQDSERENCDDNYRNTPTSCEATSFCRLGCCYDSSEGICMENTPQKVCDEEEGTWDSDKECNIPQCGLGCCVLGSQASFVTQVRCKKLSSFYGLTTDFRAGIKSELECISLASLADKGACVYELEYSKTCKFTTRQECNSIKEGMQVGEGAVTGSVEFFKDYLCSAEELGTDCGLTKDTICVDEKEEVYFVDSCGNPANIYDSSKVNDKAYWRKVVSKEQSCGSGSGNINSVSCGNCNYLSGSICRASKTGNRATYGDNICADLNCKASETSDGKAHKHGESWCSTDKYENSAGSRYFRHLCLEGEEITEPCADFRQEVCIQDNIEVSGQTFSQAACRVNRWQDCMGQKEKEDCENSDKRDCAWIAEGGKVGNLTVGCFPEDSPGLKFWEAGEAEGICSLANAQCIVEFEGDECVKNCECLEESWIQEQLKKCESLGDCGKKVNYIGVEGSKKGYKTWQGDLEETAKAILSSLILPVAYLGNSVLGMSLVGGVILPPPAPGALVPILEAFFWAAVVGGMAAFVAEGLGLGGNAGEAAFVAGFFGTSAGFTAAYVNSILTTYYALTIYGVIGIGIGVGIILFALLWKEESSVLVHFECRPWEAPTKGENCEKCNKETVGCSEYRCKSLGQACQLLNAGTSKEACAWVHPDDVNSPIIQPWEEVLTEGHSYVPDTAIRPPDKGVKIISSVSDGCVKAFSPLEFGITLNEPAQCKIDYNRTGYDNMSYYFGESNIYKYNHSQILRLPGPDALNREAPELQADGTYSLYVRCQDANGNVNDDLFVFNFCVEKGPDVTAPKIEGTSIENGMPFQYGLTELDLEVYVNEPAQCKWSKTDQSYDNMENSMTCSTHIWEMNNKMLYKCNTKLTGLRDRQDNIFYFKCKDQPLAAEADRNVNAESYKFTLKGTQPLNIIEIKPDEDETIIGAGSLATVWLELKTDNGYNLGDARCSYSTTGAADSWIEMLETGTNLHRQRQDLAGGEYKYYFQCVDLGGNSAREETSFKVKIDNQEPIIVRIYNEGGKLKLITDEKSSCTYSSNEDKECNFILEEATNMPYVNSTQHFADWQESKTYYIKCEDLNGRQPLPTECSIIVRPSDF